MSQPAVLITGATSGIGFATARRFARTGRKVIVTGRRSGRLSEVHATIKRQYHVDTLALVHDVREEASCRQVIDQIEDHGLHVDILINNAGLAKGLAPIHEGDFGHWQTMIDTNLTGLVYMTRLVGAQMVERGSGHIINVASIAGKQVYPQGNVYCATKHAVDALTRAIRLDLLPHGIRVSQVAPGHVEETEFAQVRFDGDADRAKIYEDFNPATAQDVAESIHFIATAPSHLCIQDIVLMGSQQADALHIRRDGRID